MRAAARQLAAYGPREIILTQTSGLTILAEGQIYTAPFTPRSLAGAVDALDGAPGPERPPLALDGARRGARVLAAALAASRPGVSAATRGPHG